MKKFLKIAGLCLALLLAAAAGIGTYLWTGMRSVPAFYSEKPLEGEERLRALESVERKVLNLQGVLDRAYARSRGAAGPAAPADDGSAEDPPLIAETADEPITVTFTGRELDTYFRKWLQETGYEPRMARYMTNPRIAIDDGRVILAGRMADFNAVVSLYFLPVVDEEGAVHLKLDGIYAGRIPLPDMAFEKFRTHAVAALGERTAVLRREADISPDGFANESAILLSSQEQLRELFEGKEVAPLIAFIPLPGRGFVPARVSELSVEEQELVLGVELLNKAEQAQLLEALRAGE